MSVAIAHVEPETVSTSWQKSKQSLLLYDLSENGNISAEYPMRCGTDGLVGARNEVVRQFLAHDAEWLFWIDTDMGFAPDAVDQLLAVAHPTERPIVGGLCFINKELGQDGMGGFVCEPRPTIFDWVLVGPEQHGFTPRLWYPPASLVECGATGSACVLIHRSVLEHIGEDWYSKLVNPETGKAMSEDISFCVRAKLAGFPVHVHTGVRTTHHKDVWVSEAQYWRTIQAPPATDRIDVIVPVLQRPQNAKPFMRSLRASTGLAEVHAVVEPADDPTREAWEATGATIVTGSAHTFAEKINAAAMLTIAPWVFITGDDVRFHAGWLDHAQQVARATGAKVIGTNDLANPRVMAGVHGTHLLIARDYIDEVGASWDGPGIVCHEGYAHWYVDDEIVTAAKQRGVWAAALGSRVEHLHPLFGKGEDDAVYQLGQQAAGGDGNHFRARLKRYGKVRPQQEEALA